MSQPGPVAIRSPEKGNQTLAYAGFALGYDLLVGVQTLEQTLGPLTP